MANFVVRHGFFIVGLTYRIQLQTWRQGGRRSLNMFLRDTNTAPENGTCSATPINGEAMYTYFKFTCLGWNDKDQPLSYHFMFESSGSFGTLYAGPKQEMLSLLFLRVQKQPFSQKNSQLKSLDMR